MAAVVQHDVVVVVVVVVAFRRRSLFVCRSYRYSFSGCVLRSSSLHLSIWLLVVSDCYALHMEYVVTTRTRYQYPGLSVKMAIYYTMHLFRTPLHSRT